MRLPWAATAHAARSDVELRSIRRRFVASLRSNAARYFFERGVFRFANVETCFELPAVCWGNNPLGSYGFAYLPDRDADGTAQPFSADINLAGNEALVLLGRTPPPVLYFGFTPYVMTRSSIDQTNRNRKLVFGSLSDTLSMHRIGYEPSSIGDDEPFSQIAAIVLTANRFVAQEMQDLLVQAGLVPDSVNLLSVPTLSSDNPLFLGYGGEADDFGLVLRAGPPLGDPLVLEAYTESKPFSVWRIGVPGAFFEGYDWVPYKPRATGIDERALVDNAESRLEDLVTAIQRRHPGRNPIVYAEPLVPTFQGQDCIRDYRTCGGDNPDSLYMRNALSLHRLTADPLNTWYVAGVNHRRTGKGTYTSHSVYRADNIGGIVAAYDEYAEGSAAFYTADYASGLDIGDFEDFYVFRIARKCGNEEKALGYCVEVPYPTPDKPVGAEDTHNLLLSGRIYVDRDSQVGPDKDEVVLPYTLIYE